MTFQEYRNFDALGLAALIRKGDITPAELIDLAIARLEAVNPKINAVVTRMDDYARDMLKQYPTDGPFAGVPLLIKDLAIHVKGTRHTAGSKCFGEFISPEDTEITKKFRAAGFLFLGKTNTPEFGLTPFTEPERFGPTRNPWNTDRSAGGSSGGSAAAVSAGIVPLATASDGGGSIRIPAANCGLFGLKPTRGRTPLGDYAGEAWSGAVSEHCVSRSIRDSAAMLDAIQGETAGAPYHIKVPLRPYLDELGQNPGKLRIAFSRQHPFGQPIDAEVEKGLLNTVQLLLDLGHTVEEVQLPYDKSVFRDAYLPMVVAETAAELQAIGDYLGRKITMKDVELNTWGLYVLSKGYNSRDYAYALRNWNILSRQIGHFHKQWDLFLTPTLPNVPTRIGEIKNTPSENRQMKMASALGIGKYLKGTAIVDKLAEKIFTRIPFPPIANMTGQPSMSVPLHWTEDGLPVGMMFTGRHCDEDLMFRLAFQLEDARPWFEKVPM